MKKNTFLVLILLTGLSTFAQKGFQVGGNFTTGLSYMLAQNNYFLAPNVQMNGANSSKELDYKAKFSYNTGLFFGYNFAEKHGIRVLAGYSIEGQKYQDIFKWPIYGLQGQHTKEVNFQFVNTNVSYRFAPILKGQKEKNPNGNYPNGQYKIRMRLLVGLEVDASVNAKMKYKIERLTEEQLRDENWQGWYDPNPAPDFSEYPYIKPGNPFGLPPAYPAVQPYGNGGYAPYYALGKPKSQKDYFVPLQAGLTINYGFDYIFKNNMYFGVGLDAKVGLNDINSKPYRTHPEYKKSKNYFVGLKVEIGYNILKDADKTPKKKTSSSSKIKTEKAPKEKAEDQVKTPESVSQSKEIGEKAYTKYNKYGQKKDVKIKRLKKKK